MESITMTSNPTLRKVGEFVDDGKPIYRDDKCWVPSELDRDLLHFSKRSYNWKTDEEYHECLQAIFRKHYYGDNGKVGIDVIFHRVKSTLKAVCSQPYHDGNSFERMQETIEDEVFFKTYWDKKKEFTKLEIVDLLVHQYLIQLSLVSVYTHLGKNFWEEGALWIMSIELGEPNPAIYKVNERTTKVKFYAEEERIN